MRIFEYKNGRLCEFNDPKPTKEKELQRTVERNLDRLFPDLYMIASEFRIGDKRLDTLAYDRHDRMFVIIEYKRRKGMEMSDQVSVYRDKVREYRDKCVLALMELDRSIQQADIAKSDIRLIFVKPGFTRQQIETLGNKPLVDLCEVRKFQDKLIVNQFGKESKRRSADHVKRARRHTRRNAQVSEPNQYLETDWLAGTYGGPKIPESTQNLYFDLKNAIREAFPPIQHMQKKLYAKFHLENGKTVFTVECFKHKLDLVYATNDVDLLPINDFVKDVSNVGHHGPGNHRSQLLRQSDISRALEYVGITYRQLADQDLKHRSRRAKSVDKPVQYSESDWLDGKYGTSAVAPQTRDLYFALKDAILDRFDLLEHRQKKMHSGFFIKDSGVQVCSAVCRKHSLYLTYAPKKKDLLTASEFITDLSGIGHWGAGNYRSQITEASDISRALGYLDLVYRDRTTS